LLFFIYIDILYILIRLNLIKISDEKKENKSLNEISRIQDTLFNAFCGGLFSFSKTTLNDYYWSPKEADEDRGQRAESM